MYKFDVEPFNYIYNKKSSFLDSKFVYEDSETLEFVLSNCLKINPKLLDALAYGARYQKDNQGESYILPITKAVKQENNPCINILLHYMMYIEYDYSVKI